MDQIRYPVNKPVITQTFAEHVEWAKKNPQIKYNGGIDFVDGSGDDRIFAVLGGYVDKVGYDDGYGNYIKIKHPGFYSLYAHLLAVPNFKVGDSVMAGQQIGTMGWTGNVRPPGKAGKHLHLETRMLDQVPFDPEPFFAAAGNVPVQQQPVLADPIVSTGAAGKVRIVCSDPANLRVSPGTGAIFRQAVAGTEFETTGQTADAVGLKWKEIIYYVPQKLWVAERDSFGNQMLEDC